MHYVPDEVDFTFLKTSFRPAAAWFVHSIHTQRISRKLNRDAFIPLHSKILQRMMGDGYRNIVEALIARGVVETDHRVILGRKSRGYRLTEEYRGCTHRRVEVTSRVMAKRLARHRAEQRGLWSPVHHHLHNWLGQVELPVVADRYKCKDAIERIQDKEFFLTADKYGRVHSNVTILKRSLRSKLLVNGERLVEFDIVNCQPLMLGLLLLNQDENDKCLTSINLQDNKDKPPLLTLPLCSGFFPEHRLPDDAQEYLRLCQEGLLYERLAEAFGTDLPRKRFKKKIISRIFYCKNKDQLNPLALCFADLFPSVFSFICELKKDDFRHLPRLMQRVESNLVIHRVCGQLMLEDPDCPVLTVHDGLLTTRKYAELVEAVLLKESKKLGIRPKIKRSDVEGGKACRPRPETASSLTR